MKKRDWMLCVIPVTSAILLYLPTLWFGFVYDDIGQVQANPYLRVWPGWERAVLADIWSVTDADARSNYFRPLFFLTYWMMAQAAGINPAAFHLVNVLLHAGVVAVLFTLTLKLFGDARVAFAAAQLFAVHAVHTEAVAWIAALSDIGCTLFFLLAFYFYIGWKESRSLRVLCIACYFSALLWKELAITFLLVVLAYDALVQQKRYYARYGWIAVATAAYLGWRYAALDGLAPVTYREAGTLAAAANLGRYVLLLVIPYPLSVYHPAVLGAAFAWRASAKTIWAALWVLLTLAPTLMITRVEIPVSERNLYLASVGFCWLAGMIYASTKSKPIQILFFAAILGHAVYAFDRLQDWRDNLALFQSALRVYPEAERMRLNLASEYVRRNQLDAAGRELDELLEVNPASVRALENKAYLKVRRQDWAGVRETCGHALRIKPNSAPCYFHLGMADHEQGRSAAAIENLDHAISLNPRLWQAHFYRGNVFAQLEKYQEAVDGYLESIRARPSALAYNNLGNAYLKLSRRQPAIEAYQQALLLEPNFWPARDNLNKLR